MGGLIDHLTLTFYDEECFQDLSPLTIKQLKAVEKHYRLTLPADYRAFLLNHNGGWLKPYRIEIPRHKTEDALLLYTLFDPHDTAENDFSITWYLYLLDRYRTDPYYAEEAERWNRELYASFMVIGWAGQTGRS